MGFCRPVAWPTDKKSRPESQPKFPHTRPHSRLHVPRPPGSGPGSVLRRPFDIGRGPLREWPLSGARDLSRLCSRGSRPLEECIQHPFISRAWLKLHSARDVFAVWCAVCLFQNYSTEARSREHDGGLHAGQVAALVPLGCAAQQRLCPRGEGGTKRHQLASTARSTDPDLRRQGEHICAESACQSGAFTRPWS